MLNFRRRLDDLIACGHKLESHEEQDRQQNLILQMLQLR